MLMLCYVQSKGVGRSGFLHILVYSHILSYLIVYDRRLSYIILYEATIPHNTRTGGLGISGNASVLVDYCFLRSVRKAFLWTTTSGCRSAPLPLPDQCMVRSCGLLLSAAVLHPYLCSPGAGFFYDFFLGNTKGIQRKYAAREARRGKQ